MIIAIIGTVLLYLLIGLIDMSQYGENCSKALGFLVAAIFWMTVAPLDMSIAGIGILAFGTTLGLFTWDAVKSNLGSSNFYTLLGMLLVANSLSYTPFAKRFAYWALKTFGRKPAMLFFSFAAITSFISWFVSNIGIALLMSSIANTLLLAMGEKPGESKWGAAMLTMVNCAAYFGGCILVGGSPNGNVGGMSYMQTAAGDFLIDISYANWAKIGIPVWFVMIGPLAFIYWKCFRLGKEKLNILSSEYYDSQLKELGPISGSEIRWVVIVLGMVVTMLLGVTTAKAALIWAAIGMLPGIGLKDCKTQLKALPIGVLFCVTAVPICTPICISLGYNPCTVLLPMMFCGGWFWCISANYLMYMNFGYGWYKMKDSPLPGFIFGTLCCIVVPIINYLLTPLWGLSLYL
jgi:DASS family divalent anion:Na+ symporter